MPRYRRVLARPQVADLRQVRDNAPAESADEVKVAVPEIQTASDNPPSVDLGDVPGPEPVKRKPGRPRKKAT